MVKKSTLIALVGMIALATGALSGPARATNFDQLKQCSRAPVKAWMFFTVGHASLYRQNCDATNPLSPPLRLAFGYNRKVPGDAFAKSAKAMIQRNISSQEFDQLKSRIEAFNSHYQTTTDGDLYTLDYDTDQSLVLKLNGKTLATEKGADFAHAYFTIWFGKDPFSEDLKAGLLRNQDQ